jgi:hypothetical protein
VAKIEQWLAERRTLLGTGKRPGDADEAHNDDTGDETDSQEAGECRASVGILPTK